MKTIQEKIVDITTEKKEQFFCGSLHFADIGQGIPMKTIKEKIVDITTEKTKLL